MLKKGFTLQELLISLAIVGIVAAVAVPAIKSIMPDKKKAMYMKAYNTLTNVTNDIINDQSLYWVKYNVEGEPENENILDNTDVPIDYAPCDDDWSCSGENKFAKIFATKVNYIERNDDGAKVTILTPDSVLWEFEKNGGDIDVTINLDSEVEDSCTYSADCQDPNLFEFKLSADGAISAEDPLGKAFLRNPTDMHSIKEDKELADKL